MSLNESLTAIAKDKFVARALYVGERIDLRSFAKSSRVIAQQPVTMPIEGGGIVVLYRYGACVFFDTAAAEQEQFLAASAHSSSSHTNDRSMKRFRYASVLRKRKVWKVARR